ILLYRVTLESGRFDILKNSVGHLTDDGRLQMMLVAFAFGAFIEGCAGFGTPVAVAATMLTGLGFSAFTAAAVCLLANTAPVAFGNRDLLLAWAPYMLLVVLVLLWGYQPILNKLNSTQMLVNWPGLHNLVQRVPPVVNQAGGYGAVFRFNYLSASGTSCLIAAV